LAVLNATLDSESAQRGRLAIEQRSFDICRLVRSLAVLARPEATAKGLEMTVHIDPSLEAEAGAAVGDPGRVRQIVSNLIANAVRYTVRGRIEVRLRKLAVGRLMVEVADTGPGLAHEELTLAFVPFRRVERTSIGVPGAGLGLSLSRDLARLMGGEVAADSAPEVGSRFWLELPYDETARLEADAAVQEDEPLDVSSARSLRILIAEDDGLNAAMLRSVLEQLGHQVAHVADGRRALDLAQICEFDLVMMAARMPQLDGSDAIRALRAAPGPTSGAPIVAVIGGDSADARACTEAGADAVLRKPVAVPGVARAIATAISMRKMARLEDENTRPPALARVQA
jgi:CheY-like chemotaxis protein